MWLFPLGLLLYRFQWLRDRSDLSHLTRNSNGNLRLDDLHASGLRLLGALVEVVGSEILVFGAVLEHVVGRGEH